MEIVKILTLSSVSFVVLFVLTKILGYRQISQLSFFDYVVGITIGSIAAEMSTNIDLEWWKGILAMVVYFLFCIVLDIISQKSIKGRAFFDGTPIVLMEKGVINKKSLKKARIDINDLITAARVQGYFNLSDIDTAIMENTGSISFLPTQQQRTLCPKDFNFSPIRTGISIPVILDGKIINENLSKLKINEQKLESILKQRALEKEKILLATMDDAGNLETFNEN